MKIFKKQSTTHPLLLNFLSQKMTFLFSFSPFLLKAEHLETAYDSTFVSLGGELRGQTPGRPLEMPLFLVPLDLVMEAEP